jgi:putative flippase GtrA
MMTQFKTIAIRVIRNPLDNIVGAIASRFGAKSKEVERFLKFSFVGGIGFIVDFGTLFVLQATVLPPVNSLREPVTINVAIASTIAFLAAIASNFTWNRFWTYPDSRSRPLKTQLAQFTFISLIGWLARTVWISLAYLPLGVFLLPRLLPLIEIFRPGYIPSHTAEAKLGTMAAQFVGVVVVLFWNFFANRYWTYNNVE